MAVSKTDVDASMEENVEIEDIGPEKRVSPRVEWTSLTERAI